MTDHPQKLLVLDLDETLIHATAKRLAHAEDFRVGPYHVYLRPHLADFVAAMLTTFRVAVWTSSSPDYAHRVLERCLGRSWPPVTLDSNIIVGERRQCRPGRILVGQRPLAAEGVRMLAKMAFIGLHGLARRKNRPSPVLAR